MTRGEVVRGRVRVAAATGAAPRPPSLQVRFRSMEIPRVVNIATWLDDGSFEVRGLVGEQRVEVAGTGPWSLSRVQQNGRTVTDEPVTLRGADSFVIDLSDVVTRVTGQVRDAQGRPDPDAQVVLFTEDPDKWGWGRRHVQAVLPDQEGRFLIEGLAPGRYLAVGAYLERGGEHDPEILRALFVGAQRLVLSAGESRALDIRARELP